LAKNVFQVHGVDAEGTTVLRKQLRRAQLLTFFSRLPRCVMGMEACATAHYWARELRALGHEVRLMPAQYEGSRQAEQERRCGCGSYLQVRGLHRA
jgi:transposase